MAKHVSNQQASAFVFWTVSVLCECLGVSTQTRLEMDVPSEYQMRMYLRCNLMLFSVSTGRPRNSYPHNTRPDKKRHQSGSVSLSDRQLACHCNRWGNLCLCNLTDLCAMNARLCAGKRIYIVCCRHIQSRGRPNESKSSPQISCAAAKETTELTRRKNDFILPKLDMPSSFPTIPKIKIYRNKSLRSKDIQLPVE